MINLKTTVMKFILLSAFLAMNALVFAQATGVGIGGSGSIQRRMETYSWAERPDEEKQLNLQQLFMDQQWMPGIVSFKSGRPVMSVPLIFDVHNNTLYYRQGQVIMEFVDTVNQFLIKVPSGKDSLLMKFKNQLPALQANNAETFYEVLVDGNIKLLKCRAKTIALFKDNAIIEDKKGGVKQLYFAELPGNKLVLIPMDADGIKEKMPEYSTKIAEILKSEHIKLKSENKLAELFVSLNNNTR
jgi:hypothetical protein